MKVFAKKLEKANSRRPKNLENKLTVRWSWFHSPYLSGPSRFLDGFTVAAITSDTVQRKNHKVVRHWKRPQTTGGRMKNEKNKKQKTIDAYLPMYQNESPTACPPSVNNLQQTYTELGCLHGSCTTAPWELAPALCTTRGAGNAFSFSHRCLQTHVPTLCFLAYGPSCLDPMVTHSTFCLPTRSYTHRSEIPSLSW